METKKYSIPISGMSVPSSDGTFYYEYTLVHSEDGVEIIPPDGLEQDLIQQHLDLLTKTLEERGYTIIIKLENE
jgi:hypothetical protein